MRRRGLAFGTSIETKIHPPLSQRASVQIRDDGRRRDISPGTLHRKSHHTALPIFVVTIAALVLLSLAAFAQSAPAQLHGKSIVATWSENRMQRLAGKGEFRPMSIPSGISVYVSTAGGCLCGASQPVAAARPAARA
jgi:hypothetical protein